MASNRQTQTKMPEWLTYALLGIGFGLVCLAGAFFGLNLKYGWDRATKLSSDNDSLEQRIHRELYDHQQLVKEIAYYSTPSGQEVIARRKRYAKPGEIMLTVTPPKPQTKPIP